MMFLQGLHIPHAFGQDVCISLSSLQIEVSEGQSEEISSHLQTLHVWGHKFLKAGISQLFPFSMQEMSWSLQSKPTSRRICNYVGKQNHEIKTFLYIQKCRQYPKCLPSHGCSLQFSDFVIFPIQSSPPCAAFISFDLLEVLVPLPHSLEHSDHSSHSPHLQFTIQTPKF